jgi:hypothetical protein
MSARISPSEKREDNMHLIKIITAVALILSLILVGAGLGCASNGDGNGNGNGDEIPPVISGVSASSIIETGASIAWNTDEPATSQVEYGTTPSYGSTTTLDNELVTSHSVNLSFQLTRPITTGGDRRIKQGMKLYQGIILLRHLLFLMSLQFSQAMSLLLMEN